MVRGEMVAETSGFSTDLPQSAYLADTIRRAISAAEQRSHRYVTLEHLLLALLDDTDAVALMEVARTDVASLRAASTETVNHNLATLYTPGTFDLHASYKVERVLQSASDDARRMGCTEVDGAFVAVALFQETDSPAYDLLKRHNFVYHAANSWLDRNRRPARPRPAPPPVEEPEPEPQPVAAGPVGQSEPALAEHDEEMLLEEVSDDDDQPSIAAPASPRQPAALPPFFQPRHDDEADASPVLSPGRDLRESASEASAAARRQQEIATRQEIETAIQGARPMARHQLRPEAAAPERQLPPAIGSIPNQAIGTHQADKVLTVDEDIAVRARNTGPLRDSGAAPALRQDSRNGLGPMLDNGESDPMVGPALPSRHSPPDRREQPSGLAPADLGSAVPARDLSALRPGAPKPPSLDTDPSPIISVRPQAEPRPGPEMPEGVRAEPRLSARIAERSRGLGAAVPTQNSPGRIDGEELRPSIETPRAGPSGQDLGSAVPARELGAPGRPVEPAEARPSRAHASAKERSAPSYPAGPLPSGETGPRPAGATRSTAVAERRASQQAPGAAGPKAEPPVPPVARLDDMRVRPSLPAAPAPAPAPPPGRAARKANAASKDGEKTRRRKPTAGAVYSGKLAENIPRRMKAFKAERIEVRVTREETETFLAGMEGAPETFRHDLLVTQAMSVMLRAPDGGFIIESTAPETQWIFNHPGIADKEPFGRWRWAVTPTETGQHRLQLVVAARSVDENGLPADTLLPDQIITVTTRANYSRNIVKALRWIMLMALGGAITEAALQVMRLLAKG